jgi:hypothetical protein
MNLRWLFLRLNLVYHIKNRALYHNYTIGKEKIG